MERTRPEPGPARKKRYCYSPQLLESRTNAFESTTSAWRRRGRKAGDARSRSRSEEKIQKPRWGTYMERPTRNLNTDKKKEKEIVGRAAHPLTGKRPRLRQPRRRVSLRAKTKRCGSAGGRKAGAEKNSTNGLHPGDNNRHSSARGVRNADTQK